MSDLVMPPVEINAVGHHQPVHPTAQIRPPGADQEMKVVRQQNIAMHFPLITWQGAGQQGDKVFTISIAQKDALAPISAGRDVINCVLKLKPKRSRHFILLPSQSTMSKYLDATPFPSRLA